VQNKASTAAHVLVWFSRCVKYNRRCDSGCKTLPEKRKQLRKEWPERKRFSFVRTLYAAPSAPHRHPHSG
jgi:hypothetical protein